MPPPPLPHHQPHSTNEPTRSHKRLTNLPSTYLVQQYHHHRLLRGWGASSTARASNGVSGEGAHVDRNRSHHARGTNDGDDSYKLGLRSEGRLWFRIINHPTCHSAHDENLKLGVPSIISVCQPFLRSEQHFFSSSALAVVGCCWLAVSWMDKVLVAPKDSSWF